jgi:hypothetical protein
MLRVAMFLAFLSFSSIRYMSIHLTDHQTNTDDAGSSDPAPSVLPTQIANQREIKIPNRPIAAARITYIPTKRKMTVMIRVLSAFDISLDEGVDPGFLDRKRVIEAQQRSDKRTA